MHNHKHNRMHCLYIPPLEDASQVILKLESLLSYLLCAVYCANGLRSLSDISICFHWEFDRISGFQSNSWHTEMKDDSLQVAKKSPEMLSSIKLGKQ